MKQLIAALLAIAVIGGVVAGCSGGSETGTEGTEQPKEAGSTGG